MVKSKKSVSKKSKQDETTVNDVEATVEDSVVVDGKTEDGPEETTQENGDDSNLKKKSKGKTTKKEDAEESSKEEECNLQNGAEDASAKKKSTPKRAAKPAKPQAEPARKSSRTPKPVAKEGTEESYEVEKIVDFRLQRGKPQYLVRWKGYSSAEDTWENESSLNCPELLQKYKEETPNKAKKRSSSKSPSKSKKQKKEVEEDYEVEEIVGMRVKKGKKEFKIRWKGYKSSDDSWEPEKHLSCQDLISKYLEQHKDDVQNEEKKPAVKTPAKSAKSKRSSKAK